MFGSAVFKTVCREHVDTTLSCTRTDAQFSRAHITVHNSLVDPHALDQTSLVRTHEPLAPLLTGVDLAIQVMSPTSVPT